VFGALVTAGGQILTNTISGFTAGLAGNFAATYFVTGSLECSDEQYNVLALYLALLCSRNILYFQ